MKVEHIADGVTLYCADCLDVMPGLLKVDHVITDPPYEQDFHNLHASAKLRRSDGSKQRAALDFDGINEIRPAFLWHVKAITRGWLLAFCNVEGVGVWRTEILAADLRFNNTCAWVKPDSTPKMNGSGPAIGFECMVTAWCGARRSVWNGGGKRGVFEYMTNGARDSDHPTEKPIGLMRDLVKLFTMRDQTILDPFMGSGTTGVAAIAGGRKFIGIERDRKYFDVACKRIAAATTQNDFWIDKPERPRQISLSLEA